MRVYRVMIAKYMPHKETLAPVRFYPDRLIPRVLLHVVAGVFDLRQRSHSANIALEIVIFSNGRKPLVCARCSVKAKYGSWNS